MIMEFKLGKKAREKISGERSQGKGDSFEVPVKLKVNWLELL